MLFDPKDPGQPKRNVKIYSEPAEIFDDYVRTFVLVHGPEYAKMQQRMSGVMREFLILSFMAEAGLQPGQCMLLECTQGNTTTWRYVPAPPENDLLTCEKRVLKMKIHALERELDAARQEIAHLKTRR